MSHFYENKNELSSLSKKYGSFMLLKIFVNKNIGEDFINIYREHIQKHNTKVFSDKEPYFDSGFDLLYPIKDGYICCGLNGTVNKIDFQIKCSATMFHKYGDCETLSEYVTGYMLFPRSSLSKTPLRLANSVGVIDSGYRGNIIGMFDCFSETYTISYMERLLQICSPNMAPIYVVMVENEEELGINTSRGEGGFGSTGK
jgi:dUTP pyrophosphatase